MVVNFGIAINSSIFLIPQKQKKRSKKELEGENIALF